MKHLFDQRMLPDGASRSTKLRGSPSYIDKLPPELLCAIFWYCAPTPENESIAFSQVSRLWREIALADRQLWCTPIIRFPKLAVKMIDRAGGMPLTIHDTISTRDIQPNLKEILRKHAVEDCRIYFCANPGVTVERNVTRLINRLLPRSRTTLKYLYLNYPGTHGPRQITTLTTRSRSLFPNLRHMILWNLLLPWKVMCCSNLRVLALSFGRGKTDEHLRARMTVGSLASLLQETPNIVRLYLGNAIWADENTPLGKDSLLHECTQNICLPYLVYMELMDTPYHLIVLLSSVDFEVSTLSELAVQTRHPSSPEQAANSQSLFHLVANKVAFVLHAIPAVQSIAFKTIDGPPTLSTLELSCYSGSPHTPTRLQVSITTPLDLIRDSPKIWAETLDSRFSLETLEVLTIKTKEDLPVAHLPHLYDRLATSTSITKVVIRGHAAYLSFLACYATDLVIHFPAVECLCIKHVRLSTNYGVTGSNRPMTGAQYLAAIMLRLKVSRRPIPQVVFQRCFYNIQDIQEFVDFGLTEHVTFQVTKMAKKNILKFLKKAG